jgi:hypothetical protein
MAMKQFLFILCFLLSNLLCAQQLYFIRATVDENYTFSEPQLAQLIAYMPTQDTVLQVRKDYSDKLHPGRSEPSEITYFPRLDAFCLIADYSNKFFLLRTHQPDTLFEITFQCPPNYSYPLKIGVIDNQWTYRCHNHESSQKKDVFLHKGIDSLLIHYFDIAPSDYKDLYITGVTTQLVELKPNDSYMYLPIVADIENRPPFALELPEKYRVSQKGRGVIEVNDELRTVIYRGWRKANVEKNDYGLVQWAAYNKKQCRWFEIDIKGNATTKQVWGHWLAGAIAAGVDNEKKFVPSPGKAVRDSVEMEDSFDIKSENDGFYRPGILYLLNTDTEKYIEWETGQGDSEILLVQEEAVYYRVFDAIYKMLIVNGEKLGRAELLVKDNQVVPYIHWAFLGGK